MSHRLFDRSPDLKRLQDEGYNVQVKSGFLVMRDIPYVASDRSVKRGFFAAPLLLAGDTAQPPDSHTIHFGGEFPCDSQGRPIERIRANDGAVRIDGELVADRTFSAKPQPTGKYANYYDKFTTYCDIVSGPAQRIDPSANAKTFPVIVAGEEESVFRYVDTASSRAEITAISAKLRTKKIAIVGLGGTGGYVLDLVAKTQVEEIHLFDGDTFFQHNAFRAPGAASFAELEERLPKVTYFERVYGRMRRGIMPHPEHLTPANVEALRGFDFVFLCLEGGDKEVIVRALEEYGVAFIDVGMGLYISEGSVGGIIRVTTSTPEKRDHIWNKKRIPFVANADMDEYGQNIQIADLNALNAALAVTRWKRYRGFYVDQEREHFSTYAIGGNDIANEDK